MGWENLLNWAGGKYSHRKGFNNYLARITLSTTVYFLWAERNHRIFQNHHQPPGVLSQEVLSQIRLLLLSYKGVIPDHIKAGWNV